LNRIAVAIGLSLLVGATYAGLSFHLLDQLDFKGQAALVAVSSFSFVTSAFLLGDMSRLQDSDLGKLGPERPSLVIGLIFVCIYVPISIGTTFLEVVRTSNKQVDAAVIAPAQTNDPASGG